MKITAITMIQVAGKPVENVEKALKLVLERIKEDDRWKVLDSEIIEPELDEESTLYSGIIEVKARFEDPEKLMEFIVDYTPNSVEVEDPTELKFDSVAFTSILNDMSSHFLKINMKLRQANAHLHMLNNKVKGLEGKDSKKY
jgi:hypothetical protein